MKELDAKGLHYRELNSRVMELLRGGHDSLVLRNVNGQRYIGAGVQFPAKLEIHGTPGNDLAAFMDGLRISVFGNAQDAAANTMNKGELVIHGNAGDLPGYSMRGGEVFIRGSVGYRAGVHMKAYGDQKPLMVIGGKAGDFLGEYMAGGDIVLFGLGCSPDEPVIEDNIAPGMHGGRIFVPGPVDEYCLGREVQMSELDCEELTFLKQVAQRYVHHFGGSVSELLDRPFVKLAPKGSRPYRAMYA